MAEHRALASGAMAASCAAMLLPLRYHARPRSGSTPDLVRCHARSRESSSGDGHAGLTSGERPSSGATGSPFCQCLGCHVLRCLRACCLPPGAMHARRQPNNRPAPGMAPEVRNDTLKYKPYHSTAAINGSNRWVCRAAQKCPASGVSPM